MKNLLLTFDLEEFVCPAERKLGISKERLFDVSREGLKNIIKLLKENKIREKIPVIIVFNDSLKLFLDNKNPAHVIAAKTPTL